jgi:Na+/phosphate symporter
MDLNPKQSLSVLSACSHLVLGLQLFHNISAALDYFDSSLEIRDFFLRDVWFLVVGVDLDYELLVFWRLVHHFVSQLDSLSFGNFRAVICFAPES